MQRWVANYEVACMKIDRTMCIYCGISDGTHERDESEASGSRKSFQSGTNGIRPWRPSWMPTESYLVVTDYEIKAAGRAYCSEKVAPNCPNRPNLYN